MSSCKVMSLQTAIGSVVSSISKSTSQLVVLPDSSVAITVTVMLLLIKVLAAMLWLTVRLELQLSVASVTRTVKSGTLAVQLIPAAKVWVEGQVNVGAVLSLSLIHISEPTRPY